MIPGGRHDDATNDEQTEHSDFYDRHCCPSRATFFSGLYPTEHGVWNNVEVGNALSRGLFDDVRLWSEDLSDSGYEMYFSGKWHVSAVESPTDRGWEMTPNPRAQARDNRSKPAANKPNTREWGLYTKLNESPQPHPAEREEAQIIRPGYPTYTHYGTKDNPFNDRNVIDDAISRIAARAKELSGGSSQPWCQYIGPLGPHDPYFVPQQYLDMYNIEDIELPASFHDPMLDKPALYRRTRDRFAQLTEQEHREALRHYLAFCTYEDALFGDVLKALDESGERDNTVVIYLSDHGDYAGEHGLWCKGLPNFRSAYHIPALIRWPQELHNPGRIVDAFVSLADFAPTFLELAEVAYDRKMTGRSLLPFLRDEPAADWRQEMFTQSNGNELYGIQRSVMTDRYKYVFNGFDYDELYDLQADPDELFNLAQKPEYEGIVRELCGKLWKFAHAHDDVCINPYIMVALAPHGPGVAFR
ncbi:MAG: sulfatase [Paenibacillaceae bacterium]|nr:sulfatase [Paenibacillaceae bacterium]